MVREGNRLVQDFDGHFLASALSTDDLTERTTTNDFEAVNLLRSNLRRSLRNVLNDRKHG